MTTDQWIDIAGVVTQAFIAIAAFFLAWRVYMHTRTTDRLNHINTILGSINLVNSTALSSDENLIAMDALYSDGRDSSKESARKRWSAFLLLQTHQQMFLAAENSLVPKGFSERNHEQLLDLLLRDAETMSLVRERGFDERFVRLCERRSSLMRKDSQDAK